MPNLLSIRDPVSDILAGFGYSGGVAPALPVIEQIAREIAARLAGATIASGYEMDITPIRAPRPGYTGAKPGVAVIEQTPGAVPVELTEVAGIECQTLDQSFCVSVTVAAQAGSVPVETLANRAAATVAAAIESGAGDWSQFGGLAILTNRGEREVLNNGRRAVAKCYYLVRYRTPVANPYDAR